MLLELVLSILALLGFSLTTVLRVMLPEYPARPLTCSGIVVWPGTNQTANCRFSVVRNINSTLVSSSPCLYLYLCSVYVSVLIFVYRYAFMYIFQQANNLASSRTDTDHISTCSTLCVAVMHVQARARLTSSGIRVHVNAQWITHILP